ncbi:Ion transport protein [Pseudovibrio axinellae]|uniref:Ion transport protein n=1 Tax=Pseudovibrio axinellae TaxID=989403 RepID=A0A165YJL2_9HYPH|nr:ion transporter [Pseudovibrio axinellae]KZL18897.1 Ion transport protein [Pseudovibrio axinellae]SEP88570.1 voltage-gated sodium channel [Pseudovibrio axinellae]
MRAKLRSLIESREWEYTIVSIIVLNAIVLGLDTSRMLAAHYGWFLHFLDEAILVIYVIELTLRIVAYGPRFFKGPWNLFDFFIISIALVPAAGPATILRSLRILRILRLISVVPSLRSVIGGLIRALPGMGSIVLLMALVFYVFSVMATRLYSVAFPEWFGSIGASAYSLFQIMTLESWSMGIVRPVMEVFPNAWLFFIPFILCTAFTVLNLFIGIIVSAMQQEHERDMAEDRNNVHEETRRVLSELQELKQTLNAELTRQRKDR